MSSAPLWLGLDEGLGELSDVAGVSAGQWCPVALPVVVSFLGMLSFPVVLSSAVGGLQAPLGVSAGIPLHLGI